MPNHNASNERVKRRYFAYLREASGYSEASITGVASALARFEHYTRYRDFKLFHIDQAIHFKKHLAGPEGETERLSKATRRTILMHLKRFFLWLARETGYKARIGLTDGNYFTPNIREARIATATRERPFPTLEQVRHAIFQMPAVTDIERRNRAVVALALLTGARDSAIASLKLKHVDLRADCIDQDARDVRTKFGKTFRTYFFPVGDDIRIILADWVHYLRTQKLFGDDDPLFPATDVAPDSNLQFRAVGLKRAHWSTATPIRTIFRDAFTNAGLPYFNPHAIRKTLVSLAHKMCKNPEDLKAWSQNLGHEKVLTTLVNYGNISPARQQEVLRGMRATPEADVSDMDRLVAAVARQLAGQDNKGMDTR